MGGILLNIIIMKYNEVTKYKLESVENNQNNQNNQNNAKYYIVGLEMAYYKYAYNNYKIFDGNCALVSSKEHKGYCFIYSINNESDDTIKLSPLYNKEGNMILVEYDHDNLSVVLNKGYKDYSIDTYIDCQLIC